MDLGKSKEDSVSMRFSIRLIALFFALISWGFLTANNWEFIIPVGYITDICQVDSLYWIGTNGGVFRLDTVTGNVDHFTEENSTLPSRYITGIALGWDGRIWVGTHEGLAIYNDSRWETWDAQEIVKGKKNSCAEGLLADEFGNVWIALSEDSNEFPILILTPGGIRTNDYEADIWWLGSYNGKVFAYASANMSYHHGPWGRYILVFDGNLMRRIQVEEFHSWFGLLSADGALFEMVYKNEGEEELRLWDGVTDRATSPSQSYITTLRGSSISFANKMNKRLLVVLDGHLYEYSSSALKEIVLPENLEGNINSVYDLPNGKIVATAGLLVVETGEDSIRTYSLNPSATNSGSYVEGVFGQHIFDMVVDSTGKAWFTSKTELSSYDGTNWHSINYPFQYTEPQRLSNEVSSEVELVMDSRDNLWVRYKDDLYVHKESYLTLFRKIPGLKELVIDGQDRLWILSDKNLQLFENGVWKLYNHGESGLSGKEMYGLQIDSNDRLWVQSGNQTYSFNGGKWNLYFHQKIENLHSGGVYFVDNLGRLWSGSTQENLLVCYNKDINVLLYPVKFCNIDDTSVGPDGTWYAWGVYDCMDCQEVEAIHFDGEKIIPIFSKPKPGYNFLTYFDNNNNNVWFVFESVHGYLEIGIFNENGVQYGK